MKSFFEEFDSVEPNQGGFITFRRDGSFEFNNEQPAGLKIIDRNTLEELIFLYCKDKIKQFSGTANNREVYAFVLYLDTHYGDLILYLNTESALHEFTNKKEEKAEDKEWQRYYGIGDFEYMIDEELPEPLGQIMKLYLRIYDGQGSPRFDYDVVVKNEIFVDKLINIGANVINRLKPFPSLNKSIKFIGYVADHDEEYFSKTVDEDFYNKHVKLSYL